MKISHAISAEDIADVRRLFEEYAASLGVDLGYQGFAAELAGLPGSYAAPRGRLLLARVGDSAVGCVALRPFDDRCCEMKRLFVRAQHQGLGAGRKLVVRLIEEANASRYATILLDTLPSMHSALRLYESLGFVRRRPYFHSPIAGNVFMELQLQNGRRNA